MVPVRATIADVPAVMLLIGRVFSEYGLLLLPSFEVPDLLAFNAHYTPPKGASSRHSSVRSVATSSPSVAASAAWNSSNPTGR